MCIRDRSYTVYCSDKVHVTDNVFGPAAIYGAKTGTCATWKNNVWEATGKPVP